MDSGGRGMGCTRLSEREVSHRAGAVPGGVVQQCQCFLGQILRTFKALKETQPRSRPVLKLTCCYPLQLLQDINVIKPEPPAAAQVKLELQQ